MKLEFLAGNPEKLLRSALKSAIIKEKILLCACVPIKSGFYPVLVGTFLFIAMEWWYFALYLGVTALKGGGRIYGFNYSGGENRTHGQIERTPRIDSFEAARQGGDGVLLAGSAVLDFFVSEEADPGGPFKTWLELCGRWRYRLVHIDNGFSGKGQTFFLCPYCLRRVRFLYFDGADFACRQCAGLNYHSQQKTRDSMDYYRRGLRFAENKLKVNPAFTPDGISFCEYVPERPKGMHESTYRRRMAQFMKYRDRHTAQMLKDLRRFVGPAAWAQIEEIARGDFD